MRRSAQGFTIVEVLVVVSIIAALVAILVFIINPFEIIAQGRDSQRLADLQTLQRTIETTRINTISNPNVLCSSYPSPCSGKSTDLPNPESVNGNGWVKVDFSSVLGVSVTSLPKDPKNDSSHHYIYYSDNVDYEIDVILESKKGLDQMKKDGGNDDNKYEVGTKLDFTL